MRHFPRVTSLLLLLLLPSSARAQTDLVGQAVDAELARREVALIAFRRDLHRHPEVSGAEVRTAARVAEALRTYGLEVREGVGGHGVVGVLRGGAPGPVVAYRADMDAVPFAAPDPVPFASEAPGVRHVCGHDVHTTIGVALAAALAATRRQWAGTVVFLFQPAEERATGADAMLAADPFGAVRPTAILALHTAPLEVGRLGTRAGALLPARDRVRLTVRAGDSAAAAAAAYEAHRLLAGAGRRDTVQVAAAPPRRAASGEWLVEATLTLPADQRAQVRPRLQAAIHALERPGVRLVTEWTTAAPGATNDSAVVRRTTAAIEAALGRGAVEPLARPVAGFSEDFGAFQRDIPGAMYFLGVSNASLGTVGMPHTPDYVADEGAIAVGARAMAAALLALLAAPSPAAPRGAY